VTRTEFYFSGTPIQRGQNRLPGSCLGAQRPLISEKLKSISVKRTSACSALSKEGRHRTNPGSLPQSGRVTTSKSCDLFGKGPIVICRQKRSVSNSKSKGAMGAIRPSSSSGPDIRPWLKHGIATPPIWSFKFSKSFSGQVEWFSNVKWYPVLRPSSSTECWPSSKNASEYTEFPLKPVKAIRQESLIFSRYSFSSSLISSATFSCNIEATLAGRLCSTGWWSVIGFLCWSEECECGLLDLRFFVMFLHKVAMSVYQME